MTTPVSRLSRIDTPWSILRRAHDGSDVSLQWARQTLLDRYGCAVRRYLRAALRADDAAEEVFQEFALRLVRGDFHAADPQRGRFRNFVKTTLYHLIVDFRRRAGRDQALPLDERSACVEQPDLSDDLFIQSWRQELLDRCWARLREAELEGGAPYYSALRHLVDDPQLSSDQIAERLSQAPRAPVSAGNVRVVIHRARQMFADRLVFEVAESLEPANADDVEQELGELNLLPYCKGALARHFPGTSIASGRQDDVSS